MYYKENFIDSKSYNNLIDWKQHLIKFELVSKRKEENILLVQLNFMVFNKEFKCLNC